MALIFLIKNRIQLINKTLLFLNFIEKKLFNFFKYHVERE